MDVLERAQNAAAAMLGRKSLTCRELCDRLCRKGFDKAIAEQVVEQFLEVGYLDDRRYAEMYLEDAVHLGAKGLYRIRQELLQKGISASLIQSVIEDTELDIEGALQSYVEHRQLWKNVHSRKDLENLKARLIRRGYSLGEVCQCLSQYTFRFDEDED